MLKSTNSFFSYDLRALNKQKFNFNREYIDYRIVQGLSPLGLNNLIRTSGLCEADTALLTAYCIEQGYTDDYEFYNLYSDV